MRHVVVPSMVLGTILALGLLTAVPVAAGHARSASGDPKALAVATNTAVKIRHGSYGLVSSLPLPSGRWVVVAKVDLTGGSNLVAFAPTSCALSVGNFADESGAAPSTLSEGHSDSLLLTASASLASPGAARLRCRTTAPLESVRATTTHIMAYRMGTLSVGSLGGSYVKLGSGSPKGIWGWSVSAPVLPGGAATTTLGSLPLTQGRWLLIGKVWLHDSSALQSVVFCDLHLVGQAHFIHVSMGAVNSKLEQRTVALQQTVSTASPANASLDCLSTGPAVSTSWVELVAIKVGKLTTTHLGAASATQGSGSPRVIQGYRDASEPVAASAAFKPVGQIALPAGRWAVEAMGSLMYGGNEYVKAECQLEVGAAHDRDEADLWHYTNAEQEMSTQLLVALPSAGHATVACRQTGSHSQVSIDDLRIVAMRTR